MNLSTLRANWRTSLSGIGAALFSILTVIAALPYELGEVATIIPAEWKAKVAIAGAVAAALLRVINSICAKDSSVSGNGTRAKPIHVPDSSGLAGTRIVSALIAFALLGVLLSGCASISPATKEKLGATGTWLLGKAVDVALGTVVSAAQSQMDAGEKADWLDSLATGLRAEVSSEDIREIARIWAPAKPHWQDLSTQLAALLQEADGLPEGQRREAVAQALQVAAEMARAKPAGAFARPTAPDVMRLDTLYHAGEVIQGAVIVTKIEEK